MIKRTIPSTSNNGRFGTPLLYGHQLALSNAFNNYVLLSGGSSIRSTTTTIAADETWQIVSANGKPSGSVVKFGDLVALARPAHGVYCFRAGPL